MWDNKGSKYKQLFKWKPLSTLTLLKNYANTKYSGETDLLLGLSNQFLLVR